jgi:hypothetical protein
MVKVILTKLAIIATQASFAQTVVKFTNQIHASFALKFMNHHPLPFLWVSLIHNPNEPHKKLAPEFLGNFLSLRHKPAKGRDSPMTLQMGRKLTNSFGDGTSPRNLPARRNFANVPEIADWIAVKKKLQVINSQSWKSDGASLNYC